MAIPRSKTLGMFRAAALTAAAIAMAGGLTACRGDRTDKPPRRFFPDMDDQQRWDPQEGTDFYVDGRTLRPQVVGTVPFGRSTIDPEAAKDQVWAMGMMQERQDFLAEDPAVYRGKAIAASGQEENVRYIPIEVTTDLLKHGQQRFNIYCSACHGFEGDGLGMVGVKWAYPPANMAEGIYADRDQEKGTDGHLFDVVRNGVWDPATGANKMPGYSHALDERDSWAVVAYIRALQKARAASVNDLNEREREGLGVTARGAGQMGGAS